MPSLQNLLLQRSANEQNVAGRGPSLTDPMDTLWVPAQLEFVVADMGTYGDRLALQVFFPHWLNENHAIGHNQVSDSGRVSVFSLDVDNTLDAQPSTRELDLHQAHASPFLLEYLNRGFSSFDIGP